MPEEISLRASELGIKPGFEVLVLTAKEGKTETREWTYVHKDGSHIPVILSVTAIRDHHNNITGFLGIASDITKRKEAEQQKEKLYNQLLQAQKIESVGRLAGGVAHDFNNMLGVIIGYTELAMMDVLPYSSTYGQLKEILQAAQRSAELTRQLLAFARQQTAMPVITDINEIIAGMLKMLHRLIGENIDLVWKPGHALWKVKIDSTQFNQILANLVVNSRDAIDGTGTITLETDNTVIDSSYCAVHADFIPGEYVMLTVSDTGTGMTKEIIQHIFEPFFTTKEPGKGTGLGLATIYGIVRQNNGFINVYSEPGEGSIFKIYIPRCEGKTIQVLPERVEVKSYAGIETVLISEDEEFYLNLCKTVLEKNGYKVITATRPGQAISMAENYAGNIDLLITDIVMPEMNGLELFKKLRNIKSNIKCIYMSGYTANIIANYGLLKEGVNFIQKPFSVKTLTEKVRNVLDER